MNIIYENWSCEIFEGFYESNLFNSDTEYYLNDYLNDGEDIKKEYEIKDFKGYCNEVSELYVDRLCDNLDDVANVFNSYFIYHGLYSPQYYNFSTDKIQIEMDVNLDNLLQYIEDNKTLFDNYLHENFTSYDGFWSFIDNNYTDFMNTYNSGENDRELNVMIEFYLLNNVDLDNTRQQVYDELTSIQLEYIEEIETSNIQN